MIALDNSASNPKNPSGRLAQLKLKIKDSDSVVRDKVFALYTLAILNFK